MHSTFNSVSTKLHGMDIYLVLSCDCWLIHFLPYANEIGICSRCVMASLDYQWANGLGNPFLNSSQPFYLGASEQNRLYLVKIYSHTHPPPLKNCASVLILSLIFNLILLQHLVWEMWACNLIDLVLQKSSHCQSFFYAFVLQYFWLPIWWGMPLLALCSWWL